LKVPSDLTEVRIIVLAPKKAMGIFQPLAKLFIGCGFRIDSPSKSQQNSPASAGLVTCRACV
jgi:hypothetical protein